MWNRGRDVAEKAVMEKAAAAAAAQAEINFWEL
jgi:hypothetical protein